MERVNQITKLYIKEFLELFYDAKNNIGVICRSEDELIDICQFVRMNAPRFGVSFKSDFMPDDPVDDVDVLHVFWRDNNIDGSIGIDYYKGTLLSASPSFYIEDENNEHFMYIYFSDIDMADIDIVMPQIDDMF